MRRHLPALLGLACLAVPALACFGTVLFRGEQFVFRDAGHFYYPLYQRVQQEWAAGRWPLWAPEENGGMPLLGNPTAAVLYPGKLLFTPPISYPWGMRLYIVGHLLLAVGAMYALMRSWGVGRAGSALAALSYGFGMPVLFQTCNVIFLVGAAWLPLGFRAADRWLRLGRRWGLVELAVILAMETLGGDPQAAYLTALCAGGYALGLARSGRLRAGRVVLAAALVQAAACAVALGLSWAFRPGPGAIGPRGINALLAALPAAGNWGLVGNKPGKPPGPADLLAAAMPAIHRVVLAGWGVAGLMILARRRRAATATARAGKLAGLGVACGLGLLLAAAQVVPVAEFAGLSLRAAAGGPHDYFPFSVEPHRLAELAWPAFFGTPFMGENRSWLGLLPPGSNQLWLPSLYLGGLTLALALGGAGSRGGPPGRAWMTAVAALALLASLGQFLGPLYWARFVPAWSGVLGPHDPFPPRAIRTDHLLRDGDLGPYWLLATALPGFGTFRYPAKLLVLASLAISALAGIGWDRARAGRGRRIAAMAAGLGMAGSAVALAAAALNRGRILATFRAHAALETGGLGPLHPPGAYREILRATAHGTAALGLGLAAILLARRRPRAAGILAVAILAVDLALANSRFVITLPQALFDAPPAALGLIADFDRRRPHPAGLDPYRVHRMPIWEPTRWMTTVSPDRIREMVTWERDTLQPKYALPYGLQYTLTEGTTELYDYWWFFAPFEVRLNAETARALGGPAGRKIVYQPRLGFDLWNTRYFLVPAYPARWETEHRSYASFLPQSTLLHPTPATVPDPEARRRWVEYPDWQLYRNERALPRAWAVHDARFLKPIVGLQHEDRKTVMRHMCYELNPFWSEPGLDPVDPRRTAWIEADDPSGLAPFVRGPRADDADRDAVIVRHYGPQRVELDVRLGRPGVVILSDVFYPGWRLTLDGQPAEILRVNRLMRGAAVPAKAHRLVYTYEPESFRLGAALSAAGLVALAALAAWSALGRSRGGEVAGLAA